MNEILDAIRRRIGHYRRMLDRFGYVPPSMIIEDIEKILQAVPAQDTEQTNGERTADGGL